MAKAIHGHTRLTLTDVDGREEVIEKDNIITNLVPNIFSSNFLGTLNYKDLLPITKLFSGCLLYNSSMSEPDVTADDTVIPAGSLLVAHAGNVAYSGADSTAGNPNGVESGQTTGADGVNGYKYVWDWATSAGNGTINTVSLTHGTGGLLGRNGQDASLPSLITFSTSLYNSVLGEDLLWEEIALFDWEGNRAFTIDRNGTTLEVKSYGFGGKTLSLFDAMMWGDAVVKKSYTLSLSEFTNGAYSIQYESNKIYINYVKSSTSVKLITLDLATGDVTENTVSYSGVTFWTNITTAGYRFLFINNLLPIVNGYVYVPASDKINLYKCSISNPADVTKLPSTLTEVPYSYGGCSAFDFGSIVLENNNLIYDGCSVINDVVIPTKSWSKHNVSGNYNLWNGGHRLNKGVYLLTTASVNGRRNFYIGITPESISTINVLKQSVNKDSSKTMKLEYTLKIEEEK